MQIKMLHLVYFHWKKKEWCWSGSFQESSEHQFIFLLQTLSCKSTANGKIFQWTSEHKGEQLYMLTKTFF